MFEMHPEGLQTTRSYASRPALIAAGRHAPKGGIFVPGDRWSARNQRPAGNVTAVINASEMQYAASLPAQYSLGRAEHPNNPRKLFTPQHAPRCELPRWRM